MEGFRNAILDVVLRFVDWLAALSDLELLLFWSVMMATAILIWYLYEQFYWWFRGYVFDIIDKGRAERRQREREKMTDPEGTSE